MATIKCPLCDKYLDLDQLDVENHLIDQHAEYLDEHNLNDPKVDLEEVFWNLVF